MIPSLFFIFRGLFIVIHVWPRWVFVAAHRLSLVAVIEGCSSAAATGFSCCGAQALECSKLQKLQHLGSRAQAQ